jgi:hypothetical protein
MEKWLLSDLHIHTTFSDGTPSLEEVVKIYGEAGFDAIAITDHPFDTQSPRGLELYDERKSIKDLKDYFHKIEEVSRWAKDPYDLLVIPGMEVCNLLEDYHILGIDLKDAVKLEQRFGVRYTLKTIRRALQGGGWTLTFGWGRGKDYLYRIPEDIQLIENMT